MTKGRRGVGVVLKRSLGVLLLLSLVGVLVWVFLPEPVPVDLGRVTRGPLSVSVQEDGRTRVKDRYVVSAPMFAKLPRIELQAGDPVEQDQVLARLLPLDAPLLDARTRAQATAQAAAAEAGKSQAAAEVQRVKTALELAMREAARQRSLEKSGAASARSIELAEFEERKLRDALASAEFAARVAAYELEMAQVALGRRTQRGQEHEQIAIASPVDGQVLRVIQESAGVVQTGAPLLELGDLSALELVADVLTTDAVHIQPGARAFVERWGGEQALAAHVRAVEPSAFSKISTLGVEEQRVNVLLDLDAPRSAWSSLGDGYRVEVRIVLWQGDDVLTAPASAVFRHGDDWAVFAVDADDVARLRAIEIGKRNDERVEVKKGLAENARIVEHPSDRVFDGAKVRAR